MLLKFESIKFLLLLCATLTPAAVTNNYRTFCPQCEEEVWEEVPCDQISKSSTTTTTTTTTTMKPYVIDIPIRTTPKPHYTAVRPYTPIINKMAATPPPLVAVYNATATTAAPPHYITPTTATSAYNRCYCECKVGCKEFCRKVTVDGASDKQITQITKSSHRVDHGHIDTEHVHQHRFVPDIAAHLPYANAISPSVSIAASSIQQQNVYPIESSNEQRLRSYEHSNLAYEVQPGAVPQYPQQAPHMPSAPSSALSSLPPLPPSQLSPYPQHPQQPQQPLQPQQPQHPQHPQQNYPTMHTSYTHPQPAIYETSKNTYTYPDVLLDASYSVDELTRLLQLESLNKDNTPITYGQPTLYGPSPYSHYGSMPSAPTSAHSPQASVYNAPNPPPTSHSSLPPPSSHSAHSAYSSQSAHSAHSAYSSQSPSSSYSAPSTHSAPSPPPSRPATTAAERKYENKLPAAQHYESAAGSSDAEGSSLDGTAIPQYANYIDKNYDSAASAESNDHQSTSPLAHQSAYNNQRDEYTNSLPSGTYQIQQSSHYSNHAMSY